MNALRVELPIINVVLPVDRLLGKFVYMLGVKLFLSIRTVCRLSVCGTAEVGKKGGVDGQRCPVAGFCAVNKLYEPEPLSVGNKLFDKLI